jgi:3-oxoacyl-[acyl-carrier-protein] synthase II
MVTYGLVPKDPVVTGVGCISSLGCATDALIDRLLASDSGIRPIDTFDTSHLHATMAGRISGFDPAAYIAPSKLRRIDAVGRVAIAATKCALEDAGIDAAAHGDGIGLVLGTTTAGVDTTAEYLESLMRGGPTGAPALLFANTVGNAAASLCAIEFGLRGPNTTLSHKEASGVAALAYARDLVRLGRAQAIVSGGADDIYERFFLVHDWFGVLSQAGEFAEGSRPFDRTRNGFVMGEGAFMCVLEDPDAAEARGARVYGAVLGVGARGSSERINAWPTSAEALVQTMRDALHDSGCVVDDIGAVYASANSTRELDAIESEAITQVFGGRDVPVTSVKGALGEFGAAGAAALVAALLCGARGLVAPTAGFRTADGTCRVPVSAAPQSLKRPFVLINSFASGGTLYSLIARIAGPVS